MAGTEDELRKKLYRAFCPDSMELDDYVLGAIAPQRARVIRDHLKECPRCRLEIEQTRSFLEATRSDLEWNLAGRVHVFIMRLVNAAGGAGAGTGWEPALQGARGRSAYVLTYEAGTVQVILDVQGDPERTGRQAIYGLLVSADAAGADAATGPAEQFQARLEGEREMAGPVAVDEYGNFTFQSIAPGRYRLSLAGPAVRLDIEDLVIE